jgi:hypothetical protein
MVALEMIPLMGAQATIKLPVGQEPIHSSTLPMLIPVLSVAIVMLLMISIPPKVIK